MVGTRPGAPSRREFGLVFAGGLGDDFSPVSRRGGPGLVPGFFSPALAGLRSAGVWYFFSP